MLRIYKIVLFLFLSVQIYAQQSTFKLTKNKKESFYNNGIISVINAKLYEYKRVKGDTAFVEINDFPESTFFDAFISVKAKNKSKYFYVLYNPHVNYCLAELNQDIVSSINILGIYKLLNDTNFIRDDTTIYTHGQSTSHFYFGLGNKNKELAVWSTTLKESQVQNSTFAYREMTNDLNSYFSSTEPRSKRPAVIKKYKRIKLK